MAATDLDLGRYQLGWSDAEDYVFKPKKGLNESIVREMSEMKSEPRWMRDFRLRALKHFERKPMAPWFATQMPNLDFDDIYYYIKPTGGQVDDWDDLPDAIKNTYEKLGHPRGRAQVPGRRDCAIRVSSLRRPGSGQLGACGRSRKLGPGMRCSHSTRAPGCSRSRRVVAGGKSGEKEIFEITARGRTIGASGNHPFLVLRDEREPGSKRARYAARWVPAEELVEGDLVAIATDMPEFGHNAPMLLPQDDRGAVLPRVTSDDMCWFLGLYLGDGYLQHSDGYTTVGIAVDKTDTVLVEEIRDVARRLFGLDFSLSKDGYRLQARGTAHWRSTWS